MKLYQESKKVLLIGLAISVISWSFILPVAGTLDFTPIYTLAIIPAFFGLMFILHGITNSGMANKEEILADMAKRGLKT